MGDRAPEFSSCSRICGLLWAPARRLCREAPPPIRAWRPPPRPSPRDCEGSGGLLMRSFTWMKHWYVCHVGGSLRRSHKLPISKLDNKWSPTLGNKLACAYLLLKFLITASLGFLHPVEVLIWTTVTELEYIDSPGSALCYSLKFNFSREDDKILGAVILINAHHPHHPVNSHQLLHHSSYLSSKSA